MIENDENYSPSIIFLLLLEVHVWVVNAGKIGSRKTLTKGAFFRILILISKIQNNCTEHM